MSSGTASMVTSARGIETAMANAAWARRVEISLCLNQPGRSWMASAPAVIPNIAMEIDTKAR